MALLRIQGQSASPGFAAGVACALQRHAGRRRIKGDRQSEAEALRQAIAQALRELGDLKLKSTGDAADMLDFQIAMLEDEALGEPALEAIAAGQAAETAWSQAMNAEISGYENADDEYFRARSADLADIAARVEHALFGTDELGGATGTIVWADDLAPSLFLARDWRDGAILLRRGSTTSHVAMLARARNVPMVVGLGDGEVAGKDVLVDAGKGILLIDPTEEERREFARASERSRSAAAIAAQYLNQPAITAEGTRITTLLNVADPNELASLDPRICDGIGLVRTELLFSGKALPSEEDQYAIYSRILSWAKDRPVTFRTLDAGGDKPIEGLTPRDESNPFLGVRGVRLSLKRPDVFKPQLRALARAAADGPAEIMVPMVAVPEELEACRELLKLACEELAREGIAHRVPPLGMMVEVPAAALALDLFKADFLSIGSNDLAQYTMAAGRDIGAVADLADCAHEAVLRLIATTAAFGKAHGIKVSLCGDAGGDERLIPLLLARGVDTLSMAPSMLARAKMIIARYPLGGAHG